MAASAEGGTSLSWETKKYKYLNTKKIDMAETALIILPALAFGLILAIIEMIFVHSDEIGMGWLMHGLHAVPFTIAFTFINMNVGWALTFIPGNLTESFWAVLGVRAAVAIIGMLKISAAAAIAGRVGERFHHTLIIGALIFALPYAWDFMGSSLEGLFPAWP